MAAGGGRGRWKGSRLNGGGGRLGGGVGWWGGVGWGVDWAGGGWLVVGVFGAHMCHVYSGLGFRVWGLGLGALNTCTITP